MVIVRAVLEKETTPTAERNRGAPRIKSPGITPEIFPYTQSPVASQAGDLSLIASMSTSGSKNDLPALIDLAASAQALISQFLSSPLVADTDESTSSASSLQADPPNPLHVLRDSATLLKAHITKLSLLLLNKPFTPSAICGIIRELNGTCLPAMMSAVEICVADVWGHLLRDEVKSRVRSVMREMEVCMREVSAMSRAEGGAKGARQVETSEGGRNQGKNRDSLASTGVVWEACDKVIELEALDVGGLAVRKAEQYRDMIKDAIEELREWGEDTEDDEDDIAGSDEERDSVEDMFGAANKMPSDRPDLRKELDQTLSRLKKVDMLYTAVVKRRLRPFTSIYARRKSHVKTVDELLGKLKRVPEIVDELANAFYELDEEEIAAQTQTCIDEATEAIMLVRLSWEEKEDEFTAWSGKWIEVIK